MARGALKIARERLVANVKGGQFDFFLDMHLPPVKSLFWDILDSFETAASPRMARQALGRFFLARGQKYLRSTAL